MAYRIEVQDVLQLIVPVVGHRFASGTGLDASLVQVLHSYQPRRESFERLVARLKDHLFSVLYAHLGSAMLLQLENGQVRRILLSDVDDMADRLSGLALMALPSGLISLDQLRQMAMCEGSLGAMHALYCLYGAQLPEMEQQTLTRILRENGVIA